MYVPRHFALDEPDRVRELVAAVGAGDLVTVGADGVPLATRLPVVWADPAEGRSFGTVLAHFARANDHWRSIEPGAPGLVIVTAPQAYVSPRWYASKAEHGRVVPTWNYSAVHLTGAVTVHDDPEWVRAMVTRLTEQHEAGHPDGWAVTDAPEKFVTGQLRAIVGVELEVAAVEAKAKLSQNRSAADREGVVAGLRAEGDVEAALVADGVATALERP